MYERYDDTRARFPPGEGPYNQTSTDASDEVFAFPADTLVASICEIARPGAICPKSVVNRVRRPTSFGVSKKTRRAGVYNK